jgi:hypothetical protein
MRMLLSLLALTLAALSTAQSHEVTFSPQSIIVNPRPTFEVDVFVDKAADRYAYPVYTVGESIRIGVRVSEDSYVYLFNVRADGGITQILPNRLDADGENNFLRAGETRYFPPQGAPYTFDVAPPTGLDKVIAVASRERLDTAQLAEFRREGNFDVSLQGEQSFAETLSIVVRPIPQNAWVTDTALFYVTRRGETPPPPPFGTLEIRSEPRARAYVDGQFVGETPVSFGTNVGQHTVRLERDGYAPFEATVNVRGGETQRVSANLARLVRTGELLVQGNVGGAEVFLDGEYRGSLASGSGELLLRDLAAGEYRLRVSAPGFESVERNVTVRANERTQVRLSQPRLAREGTVRFETDPSGAEVFVGGERVGTTPLELRLSAGEHQVRFTLRNYRDTTLRFNVAAGGRQTLSLALERQPSSALFDRLGLTPFPDARTRRLDQSRDSVRYEFETRSSLQTVYEHFHRQLTDAGWQRINLEFRGTSGRVNADYRQGDNQLEFRLNQSGRSGNYRLDLKLDD